LNKAAFEAYKSYLNVYLILYSRLINPMDSKKHSMSLTSICKRLAEPSGSRFLLE